MRYFRFGIVVTAASALAVFSSVPIASATANHGTRFVAPTGTDTGRCIAAAHPCLTINYAVSQAGAGDTIRVAAGNYPEIVTVDKPLTFLGANLGRRAGVTMQHRAPESVVQGFRSPGSPYPTAAYSFKVTLDGFTIDPQGDATLIAGGPNPDIPYHLVSLFGGPMVSVRNNIFNGGPFVSDCSYTCTTMSDFALLIQSGKFEVKNNTFTNFRRPVDISQNDAAHRIVAGSISGNLFEHITSRGIWLREGDCYGANACGGNAVDTIAGIKVTGNTFDGTGALSPVTGGPAGLVMTTAGNLVSGNTFTGDDPGVFDQVCDPANHPTSAPNVLTKNTFSANTDGIMYYAVDPSQCPAAVNATIVKNSFSGDSGYGVRWYPPGTAPNSLDARCNWWGSPRGPGAAGADSVSDQVLATPWSIKPFGPCLGS